jgi:hypothetical protein
MRTIAMVKLSPMRKGHNLSIAAIEYYKITRLPALKEQSLMDDVIHIRMCVTRHRMQQQVCLLNTIQTSPCHLH